MNKNYKRLDKTYTHEKFFVSYAVRGPVIVPGTRQDMPVLHPIAGPVHEPSPLNTRWRYVPPGYSNIGIC